MSFAPTPQSRAVADFELLLTTSLDNFVNASKAIGEPLSTLAGKVVEAFNRLRDLIQYGLTHPEPPQSSEILEYYFASIREIVDMKENYKNDQYCNHFATVGEAIVALGWITARPAPSQFIRDMREAGEYFGNRVLSKNKGDKLHMDWVKKWNLLVQDLQRYVASNFLTGFTWNAEKARGAAVPPPPPPPPAAPSLNREYDSQAGGDCARLALLNSINQGSNITRNLRPVNRNQQPPAEGAPVQPAPAARIHKSDAPKPVRQPKKLLDGKKWIVENYRGTLGITIENDDMSQSLSVYNCESSGLEVKNKMNNVVIDSCKKTSVALKAIISSVELIRCDRVHLQLDGNVPLVSLDSCDSVQIFLKSSSRAAEIISSKSSSCNICFVEDNGDYKEFPIPEQIKTVMGEEKLVSSVIEKN